MLRAFLFHHQLYDDKWFVDNKVKTKKILIKKIKTKVYRNKMEILFFDLLPQLVRKSKILKS